MRSRRGVKNKSEAEIASGRGSRATALYSVDLCGSNHDAVMRIVGEAPGQRAQSAQRLLKPWFLRRVTATSDSSADLARPAKLVVLLLRTGAHNAGRKVKPWGISPVVTRRQSAMSSLRASATIIVLRVLARPSAVRAANHWARALFF
jgi:hypothetical protein